MEKELWFDIKGWDGLYQESSHGRIRSFSRGNERILKVQNVCGYRAHMIRSGKRMQRIYEHTLIAKYNIPNPRELNEVNHINGNRSDNRIENLEWCTRQENVLHAINVTKTIMVNTLLSSGTKARSKKVMAQNGNVVREYPNGIAAAKDLKISSRTVYRAVKGKRAFTKGWQLKYA